MKHYTEEQVQEIVLKAVAAGFDITTYKCNAEHCGSLEECIKAENKQWYHSVPIAEVTDVTNAILKELDVQEIK